MATYDELFALRSNSALRDRVAVAAVVKAQSLIDLASPTAGQIAWAQRAISDPIGVANSLLNYVLAANKSATSSQISTASDSTIQTAVGAAVDKIIGGGG